LKTLIPEKEMKGNANDPRPFLTRKSRSIPSWSGSANSAAAARATPAKAGLQDASVND
jgi:hypothetical protein